MNNFNKLKNKLIRGIKEFIEEIEAQPDYDQMFEVFNRFMTYKSDIVDITGTNICLFCDKKNSECDECCNDSCSWLYQPATNIKGVRKIWKKK